MKTKWLLIVCLFFTAIVVCTAGRIEYLNIKSGYFLPRHEAAVRNWVIPELDEVLERLDHVFYERRRNSAAAEAFENGTAETAEITHGPPYSAAEQRSLESMKNLHASHTYLQWWVGSFGIVQYFLAPAALILAIFCSVSLAGWVSKSTAGLCAFLDAASIVLMLTRNYWNA